MRHQMSVSLQVKPHGAPAHLPRDDDVVERGRTSVRLNHTALGQPVTSSSQLLERRGEILLLDGRQIAEPAQIEP